jgi:REP element-mobilizing transposase RayT
MPLFIMEVAYNNLYTHFIFTTEDRQPIISAKNRVRIEKYINGIITQHECKMYAIYANPEHVHILVSCSPSVSEQQLAKWIRDGTESFINSNNLCYGRFRWQTTGAAFSVSPKEVDKVCQYIRNQSEYHKKQSFAKEFDKLLEHYLKKLKKQNIKA